MPRQNVSQEAREGLVREISDLINHEYKVGKGYLNDKEVAEILGYDDESIRNWTKRAVSLGYLSDEVVKARRKENASRRGRNCSACQKDLTVDQELEVLVHYMYDDRTNDKVMADLGISQKVYHSTIGRCVDYGLITEEEFKTREKQRRSLGKKGSIGTLPVKITEEQKIKLREFLERGKTYREIDKELGINDTDYWAKRFGHSRSNKIRLSQEQKEILVLANQDGLDIRQACEIIYDQVTDNDIDRVRRFWKKRRLPLNQSNRYITGNVISQLCEAYDSGFNVTEISKLTGISDVTVSKCLRAKGYDTQRELPEDKVELILEAHNKNMTIREAAEFSNTSDTSVSRIWKRNGLESNHLGIFGVNTQCVANDGHVCHSRSEKTIDDLLVENNLLHEKPSNCAKTGTYYEDSSMTPDWIVGNKIYVEFAGLYSPNHTHPILKNYVARVHAKMQELQRRNILHIFIFPKDDLETKIEEIKDLIEKQRRAA